MDQKRHKKKKQQKKPQQHKRIQVVDDQGWTHVTTTAASKKPGRSRAPIPAIEDKLSPAEIPDGFTLEKLRDRYEWHKNRWLTSETWEAAREVLDVEMLKSTGEIDSCVCIGLGSPSGLLRGGLVDRRSISLFQLAALESVLQYLCMYQTSISSSYCD